MKLVTVTTCHCNPVSLECVARLILEILRVGEKEHSNSLSLKLTMALFAVSHLNALLLDASMLCNFTLSGYTATHPSQSPSS